MPPNNSSIFVDDDNEEASNGTYSDQHDDSNSNIDSDCYSKSDDSWKDCDEKTTDSEASDLFSSSEEESSSEQPDNAPKPSKRLLSSASAATAAASVCCLYALEKHRQTKLTNIPLVMGQIPAGSQMESIYDKLKKGGEHEKSGGVLNQPIVPSLFVGTNGQLASTAAYLSSGQSSSVSSVVRFSETLVSSYDGAEIHLDWEVPNHQYNNKNKNNNKRGREKKENQPTSIATTTAIATAIATSTATRKTGILSGTISHPTILILHGINNSSQYGYIKSLQRAMTDRGWNAVAMNFRGCAKHKRGLRNTIPMTTPRSYTASYTGDLRSIVHQITGRMDNNRQLPLFLVGNSLGANLVTKYLGEEGLAGTLPRNVVGGVSLGNPFRFRADRIPIVPFGAMMGAARKANYFFQRKAMVISMTGNGNKTNNNTKVHVHSDPRTITLASLDRVLAPTMVRTVSHPPYETKIGYGHKKRGNSTNTNDSGSTSNDASSSSTEEDASSASAADAYWADSSCYKQGRHVSVPLLHIIARDDNLCYDSARYFLGYSLQNPNVVVVQTRTGGHLGWWHKPSSASTSSSWGLNSWADGATADFIRAVMETNAEREEGNHPSNHQAITAAIDDAHNLFGSNRISGSISESIGSDDSSSSSSPATRGTRTSMRVLPGDCDDDSTIATNDHSNYNNNNNSISRSIPRETTGGGGTTAARSPKPSRTYFQFQQVLLLQQQQQHRGDENLERNRLLEKHESIELARLFRSRL
jgi:predicted alpha/beta-fold hydrolase